MGKFWSVVRSRIVQHYIAAARFWGWRRVLVAEFREAPVTRRLGAVFLSKMTKYDFDQLFSSDVKGRRILTVRQYTYLACDSEAKGHVYDICC
jgi:hypothetical protein